MSDPDLTSGRWGTCNFDQLLRETWDEETFLFNPASGETHLLNAAAMHLLELLEEEEASFEQLVGRLFPDTDKPTLDALARQFEQLVLTGLICRV